MIASCGLSRFFVKDLNALVFIFHWYSENFGPRTVPQVSNVRFEDYDLDPLDIGGGVHSPDVGGQGSRRDEDWDFSPEIMMFFAEMVWSCYPTHVFCCAFKVKGIQGDQSQPVAAHPKLSGERNSSKMRWTSPLCSVKRWDQYDQGFGNSDFQPPKDGPKTWPSRYFSTGGRHPSPGNTRQTQVNWTPPANLEATKYYSVQLEWVVCLDDFSI